MARNDEKQAKKKKRKSEKKARRDAEKAAELAAAAAFASAQARRRKILAAIPVIAGGIAAFLAWGVKDSRLAGVVLLIGGLLFLLVALGTIGSAVTPRDRLKSGSIDFGASKESGRSKGR